MAPDPEPSPFNDSGLHSPGISKSEESVQPPNPAPNWKPYALVWWSTIPMGLTFIVIAIVSEVVLVCSDRNSGFNLHLSGNEISSGKQFVKSFVPSLVFVPLFLWFTSAYDAIKLMQPYFDMSHEEGASASESVMVGYLARGPATAFIESFKKRHRRLAILSFLAIWSGIFSALAGAYFKIITVTQQVEATVNISGSIGLGYDTVNSYYVPYVAAAGGVDNALRTGALYSPYLLRGSDHAWMVPGFTLADSKASAQGGTVTISTQAVSVQTRCVPAKSNITILDQQDDWEIVGTLPNANGCNATSYAPRENIGTWFGWVVPATFACVHGINPNEPNNTDPGYFFEPVAISFVKTTSIFSMVFCYANLVEHQVVATLTLGTETTNGISNVVDKGVIKSLGFGPNAIQFGDLYNSSRVTGIGDAIRFTLADAIMSYAGYSGVLGSAISPSLQDKILSNATSVANASQIAYLLYQSLISPSTLLVGSTYQQGGTHTIPTYRLVANKPVAHALTAFCAPTGVILIALFLYYHKRYAQVRLGAEPSGIATIAALLSKSTFPKAADLQPNDSLEIIEDKLSKFRFRLLRTGGIEAIPLKPENQT